MGELAPQTLMREINTFPPRPNEIETTQFAKYSSNIHFQEP